MKLITFLSILTLNITLAFSVPVDASIYEKYANPTEGAAEVEDTATHESKKFVAQFEKFIANMDPEDIAVFEIGAGERRVFSLHMGSAPAKIKGTYSVSGGEKNKISFSIFYPNGTIAFMRTAKKELVFSLDTDLVGEYILEFINRNVSCRVITIS